MNRLNKILLTLGCALSFTGSLSAQVNTNFQFVSFWQLTNYFNSVINTGINNTNIPTNQNLLVIGGGLTAITNVSSLYTNTNMFTMVSIYSLGGTNYTNIYTNTTVVTNTLTQITLSTNGQPIPIVSGGTGVSTKANLATLVLTNQTLLSSAYFGDLNPTHTNTVTSGSFPVALYPGQMIMTYGQSINGFIGQLYMSGADLSWGSGIQLGKTAIMGSDASQSLLVRGQKGAGETSMISVQNLDTNQYDNITWWDNTGLEQGSIGYANTNTPDYRGVNFLDDQAASGFYFTQAGSLMGGKEKDTGDFVWYQGNSTSSANPFVGLNQIFRIQRATGILYGNGAGLTNISASQVASNTVLYNPTISNLTMNGSFVMTNDVGGSGYFVVGKTGNNPAVTTSPVIYQSITGGNTGFLDTFRIWSPYNLSNQYSDISYENGSSLLGPSDRHQVAVTGVSSQGGNWNGSYTNQGQYGVYSGAWDAGNCFVTEMTGNGSNLWPWIVAGNYSGNAIAPSIFISRGHSHFMITDQLTGSTNYFDFVKSNANFLMPYGSAIMKNIGLTNTTTNLPSNTTTPKYYLTVTNNGVSGSIPIYQ